ncbi:hypothetical protein ACOMHN_048605 [Nucella lapillus]
MRCFLAMNSDKEMAGVPTTEETAPSRSRTTGTNDASPGRQDGAERCEGRFEVGSVTTSLPSTICQIKVLRC